MATISLCMIVKDEEEVLARCIESVFNYVDEIIIVDTGSTDRTWEIAAEYNAKIYDFKWVGDFSKARNYAFSLATMDYILWLDADDVLRTEDWKKFMDLKDTVEADSVTMEYILAYDEHGNVSASVRRNRLVKRSQEFKWYGTVHEYLHVYGDIIHSDIAIVHKSVKHDSDRNIRMYDNKMFRGEEFSPRDMYYYANEQLDHRKYKAAIIHYNDFLDTGEGWIEDEISACGKLADCYNKLGNKEKELESILRSFKYDRPRAEFCCRMGYYMLINQKVEAAIYWYTQAIGLEENHMGFKNPAFTTWLPHLQLCVCYDKIGDYRRANANNEIANNYRPNDPVILQNAIYLERKLNRGRVQN